MRKWGLKLSTIEWSISLMKNNNKLKAFAASKVFSYGLVLCWMVLIFLMSHQEGETSSNLSSGITLTLARAWTYFTGVENVDLSLISFLTRKSAHFVSYLILSLLIYRTAATPSIKYGLLSLGLSMVYAGSDEFHQTFISGRSGELRDVIIDSLGALTGIVFYFFFRKLKAKNGPWCKW